MSNYTFHTTKENLSFEKIANANASADYIVVSSNIVSDTVIIISKKLHGLLRSYNLIDKPQPRTDLSRSETSGGKVYPSNDFYKSEYSHHILHVSEIQLFSMLAKLQIMRSEKHEINVTAGRV